MAIGALVLASFTGACTERIAAPRACELPSTEVTPQMLAGITATDVVAGITHAAQFTVVATMEPSAATRMQAELQKVSHYLTSGADAEGACRGLNAVVTAIAELPDAPATAPDRAVLRLVVDIASAYLRM